MPISELRLIRRWQPPEPKENALLIPSQIRGIYVLYKRNRRNGALNVVYVGMAGVGRRSGVRGRLKSHLRKKDGLWTHYSVFEVWDNITLAEVAELEGLFREIYRYDAKANRLNKQKSFKKLKRLSPIIGGKRAVQPRAPAGRTRAARSVRR